MVNDDLGRQIQELSAALPELDIREALDLLGGSMAIYRQFLRKFYEQYGSRLPEFRRHLETGELFEAHRFVHSIKSLAGNLGAAKLRTAAVDLEQGMARGARVPQEEEVDRFDREFSSVIRQVGLYLEAGEP